MVIQQGDVILVKVEEKTVCDKVGKRLVLAEGEVTGHAHVLECERISYKELGNGELMFTINIGGKLVHEEHKPVDVPPGTYKVYHVREYDHFSEEVRRLKD